MTFVGWRPGSLNILEVIDLPYRPGWIRPLRMAGSLGTVVLSSLRPELRDAVAGLTPAEISPIVKSPLGFAILKVEASPGSVTKASPVANATPVVNSIGSARSWDRLSVRSTRQPIS